MPMMMNVKMITRTTSQVRRFCSAGDKGFLRDGSGANGPDMAGGVFTMTPLLVEGTSLGLGCYPRIWTANPRRDLSTPTLRMRELTETSWRTRHEVVGRPGLGPTANCPSSRAHDEPVTTRRGLASGY